MSETALRDKVAVVTGGSRGIGAAIAGKLASVGAGVVICGRNQRELNETASGIQAEGGICEGIRCDVTDLGSVEQFAKAVLARFGRVGVLVNNAGVGSFGGPLHFLSRSIGTR
jgi:3-oxoacyl-[acyl-carrier protein] reductase